MRFHIEFITRLYGINMAKILIKRSNVSGFVPGKSDLSIGELQLNTTDGKLFMKKSVLSVESIVEVGKDAATAIKLSTGRKINGVLFDGTRDISFGTNNVVEESNLYYTQARFDAAFAAKSTTNLFEGNNLYYTNARASAAAPVQSVCGRIGNIILNSSDITTALGYVPTQSTTFAVGGIKGAVIALDSRSITNPMAGIGYASGGRFRFAFANDADLTNSYADVIDLSTYNDATGGGFNSLYFNKGLQQIVHKFGPAGATAWTTRTLAYTDSAITGNAASASTATKLTTARKINGVLFDGTQDIAFGTANVPEGINLYYTQARFDAAFAAKSTTNLGEGSNLYYTQARFDAAFAAKSTSNLIEGSNLYFTNARASAAAPVQSVFGRGGNVVLNASDVVTALGYTPTNSSGAGTPGGAATLDANGKLLSSQVPAIAISDTFVVASQAAMLALTGADVGDIAVRTDVSKSFILKATGYSTLANWQELLTPADVVQSVNGQTGTVTLSTSNIAEGSNLYYTNARAAAVAPVQTVNGKTGNVVLSSADVSGVVDLTTAQTVAGSKYFNQLNGETINRQWLTSAEEGTVYQLLAVMPPTSVGTYPCCYIEAIVGGWHAQTKAVVRIYLANRDVFLYSWNLSGDVLAERGLRAYYQPDGSIQVWAYSLSGYAAMSISIKLNTNTTLSTSGKTTVTPPGTIAFDSSLPNTYKPSEWVDFTNNAKFYGNVSAASFVGPLTGNASTATLATNVAGVVAIANGGTSATTAATARSNLGLAVVSGVDGYSTLLASGTDLNTVITTGFYRGTGFVNGPDNNAAGWYYITVEGHDVSWTKQTATSYGSSNLPNITVTRVRANSIWGSWVMAYNGNVIVPVANGGTGSAVAETAAGNLGVPRINPTTPKDGDVKVAAGPIISIYATGAWRQIFPAVYV